MSASRVIRTFGITEWLYGYTLKKVEAFGTENMTFSPDNSA